MNRGRRLEIREHRRSRRAAIHDQAAARTPLATRWVESALEAHERAPHAYPIPTLAVRLGLEPGDIAKLMFHVPVVGGRGFVEQMWVQILERRRGGERAARRASRRPSRRAP